MILIPLRGPMVTSRGYVLVRGEGHHKTGLATEAEFRELFGRSELKLNRIVATASAALVEA
jgi:hypothetical protein